MDEFDAYFEVQSNLNKLIRTTKSHWDLITLVNHPIIRGKESLVKECIQDPEEIRLSQDDESVYLYYKQWGQYYLCIVVRHLNGDGYIITSYITNRIKEGKKVWKR